VPLLHENEVHVLAAGQPVAHGNIAVIAPGTGLGEAFLTWDGTLGYEAHASEGGHTDFAPADDQQIALLRYLGKDATHVSWEHVCSGIGIPTLYHFLRDEAGIAESAAVAAEMASAPDLTRFILETAITRPASSPLCGETLRLFTAI